MGKELISLNTTITKSRLSSYTEAATVWWILLQAMKAYIGDVQEKVRVFVTLLQDGGGQFHHPAALPPEKSLRNSLKSKLAGLQSRSGRSGEEKKFPPVPVFEPRSYST
jgi:hypothetical protein